MMFVILITAIAWDLLFGEVPAKLHPVVWMGRLCKKFEKILWVASDSKLRQFLKGGVLLATMLLTFVGASFLIEKTLGDLAAVSSFWWCVQVLVGSYILKSSFALKELGEAGMRVAASLDTNNLDEARHYITHLCSRDPSGLSAGDLASATISSLSENLTDSIVAPLFFYLLFGLPGAVMYRVINTLDARVGYRGRYEFFGKISARVDDVANYFPARITTVFLFAAGGFLWGRVGVALKVLRRDRTKTPSPNGGWTMSTAAGLLGVELRKPGVYILGNPEYPLDAAAIQQSWLLVGFAGGLCCLFSLIFALVLS